MSSPKAAARPVTFVENPVIKNRRDHYIDVSVSVARVVESWRVSLFSYEWLLPDGRIKALGELPEAEQPKRREVERLIGAGEALQKPILGIGLMENVEIGSGRATFMTLAALGFDRIPVHIPLSNSDEFEDFLVSE